MLSAVSQLVSFVPSPCPESMAQVFKHLRLPKAKKMDTYLACKQAQYILLNLCWGQQLYDFFQSELNEFVYMHTLLKYNI